MNKVTASTKGARLVRAFDARFLAHDGPCHPKTIVRIGAPSLPVPKNAHCENASAKEACGTTLPLSIRVF